MLFVYVWFDRILVAAAIGARHRAPNIPLSRVTEVLSFRPDLQADSTDKFSCHIRLPTPANGRIFSGRFQTATAPPVPPLPALPAMDPSWAGTQAWSPPS